MHPRINKRSRFGRVYAVITTAGIQSFYALQTTSRENGKTWSVPAAKRELLESSAHSESGEQSFATRRFSPVSRRVIEILQITVAASPGEPAGINFDDCNADDSNFFEEEGAENGEREINGEQEVVHVVTKADLKPLIVSPATNTENTVED